MRLATIVLCAALLPFPTGAALPPCAIDDLMRGATDVVQVWIGRVDVPTKVGQDGAFAACTVHGAVLRSFRGRHSVGGQIRVDVPCWDDTGSVGGASIVGAERLKRMRFVEFHMNGVSPVQGGAGVIEIAAASDAIQWTPECE